MTALTWRKGKFEIDGLGGPVDGFTAGQRWNGFACPAFTLEQGQQFLHQFNTSELNIEQGSRGWYDSSIDAFVFLTPVQGDDIETFEGSDITVDGATVHVYHIGAFAWIWSEV